MKYLSGLFLVLCCTAAFAGGQAPPNFVFVLVDDLGRQDVGVYGSSLYETPGMDQLAADGMRFDNAYVTHPRCLPSRLSLMSGRYPASYGIPGFQDRKNTKHALPLAAVTFAEVLREAGYQTGYIGKWHLGKAGGEPIYQGFDTSIMAGASGAPPSYFFPYEKRAEGSEFKKFEPYEGGEQGEYLADRLTDEALRFIEDKKEAPFLLVLAHYAVHTPIQAPEEISEKYRKKIKENGVPEGGTKSDRDVAVDNTGEYKTVQNNAVYAAMVENVDTNLGRIIERLDQLGLSDNTVVILSSDHGGLSSRGLGNKRELATSNLPYRQGKGWLYDGGIRVPMIVKWPAQVKPGSISQVQVTGTDHYPTLLEMARVPLQPEQHRDGRSYLAALQGKDYERDPMFFHSALGRPAQTGDTRSSAVIDGDWKLIQWYSLEDQSIERTELFNLADDPYEKEDLYPSNTEKAGQLEALLNEWKLSVNARLGQFKRGGI
ncbi:MAG: sulfatase [Lysobacterales bacterium]|jgi:arylsulfatase A-like enzyme